MKPTLDSFAAFAQTTDSSSLLTSDSTLPSVLDLSTGTAAGTSTGIYNGLATNNATVLNSPAATTGSSLLDSISGIVTNLGNAAGSALTTAITGQPAATVKPAATVAGLSLTEWALIGGGGLLVLYLLIRK